MIVWYLCIIAVWSITDCSLAENQNENFMVEITNISDHPAFLNDNESSNYIVEPEVTKPDEMPVNISTFNESEDNNKQNPKQNYQKQKHTPNNTK